jgi:hypothetical protein
VSWVALSAGTIGEEKLMAETIGMGSILIRQDTLLPEYLQLESEPYLKGWRLVKNLGSSGMDRKLWEAGWNFFYMAEEVKATAVGSNLEKTTRRAVNRIIAWMKSDKFNCIEITRVVAKRFLRLPYVTVSAHP